MLINGPSGYGVMHAPALGLLLLEIIDTGSATTVGSHALKPSRFAGRRLNSMIEFF